VGFNPVDQQPDFPALEGDVLERWRERNVFHRSLQAREEAPPFRFYEGPPFANGPPGVHHVPSRTFKDVFTRHRTMKGHRVPREGGWDCHGIPVELNVERELGFTSKADIEAFGVAEFNARCRESVLSHVDDWVKLSERIGYWVDFDKAYLTMATPYVESVWWSLAELWDRDLIYEDHRVVPYCPRCGTALSDHEVAQGYETATDPSVYVRFPLTEGPLADEGVALLVWTTTPWTLISNTAAAVGPDIRYVLAQTPATGGPVVVAADLVTAALGDAAEVVRDIAVDELVGLHYEGPFRFVRPDAPSPGWWSVVRGDFVTTDEGTGIVHMAPAFGEDDMRMAREHGLEVVNPVDLEGRFDDRVAPWTGQFVKAADSGITEDLRERGLLVRAGEYEHTYPFCWRCSTPLLYYAKPSWFIRTTALRERLLEENAKVDWHPGHIRDGRYGNWLENNVDWALSRERYWGTPLPLWRCTGCGHVTCVRSRKQLGELAGRDLADLDPHRPYVDEVTFSCPECGGQARRVPEVIDAWYDSGSMPFAQFGYPHADGSERQFADRFPADFIAEGIDQTRGWFYSLMAVSTLLFDQNSYRTVLCLGLIVDAEGKKMSKSRGNVIDPWDVCGRYGADALRWLLLTGGSPWVDQRVGDEPLDDVVRKFLLTLWNTYYFFVTYARIDGWAPAASQAPPVGERAVLDRWILAELAETVRSADAALDGYDVSVAGRVLGRFVDQLSNWYVRRSRERFWRGGDLSAAEAQDKDAAFSTLHECLVTAAGLLAPLTPFVADELYENLVVTADEGAPDSVHLLDYPYPDPAATDDALRDAMAAARQVVELGRRARNDARVPVRQPLRAASVTLPADRRSRWEDVEAVVASELNVKAIEILDGETGLVTRRLKPNFRALGPDFGSRTPEVASAISAADADTVAGQLTANGEAQVVVNGETVTVRADHVDVLEESRRGWQVVSEGGYSVALDLEVDGALRREGIAREVIRALNDLRKRSGLELDERVTVEVHADGEVGAAVDEHRDWISREVLATDLRHGTAEGGQELAVADQQVRIKVDPL
jgi:isoleucyl-tRNA synthetase